MAKIKDKASNATADNAAPSTSTLFELGHDLDPVCSSCGLFGADLEGDDLYDGFECRPCYENNGREALKNGDGQADTVKP